VTALNSKLQGALRSVTSCRCVGDSNVYRATSSLAGRQAPASGPTRHVTTSLPVERRGDVDVDSEQSELRYDDEDVDDDDDDDDDDGGDEMTSFGSGYYDNDDDAVRDAADVKPRRNQVGSGSVYDVWPPVSSSSSDRRLDDRRRPTGVRHLDDLTLTLSTTPGAARTFPRDVPRHPAVSPTRRGHVERRRPSVVRSTSSSSSSAARRHHYADNSASATLYTSHCVVTAVAAAILFCSVHVFLSLPVIRASVS